MDYFFSIGLGILGLIFAMADKINLKGENSGDRILN